MGAKVYTERKGFRLRYILREKKTRPNDCYLKNPLFERQKLPL